MGREVLSFAGTRLRKRCPCSGRLEHKQPCRCFGVVREPNRERCVVVDLSSQIGGITDFAETNTHVAGRQGVSSGSQARTVSLPTRQQQGPRAPFPFTRQRDFCVTDDGNLQLRPGTDLASSLQLADRDDSLDPNAGGEPDVEAQRFAHDVAHVELVSRRRRSSNAPRQRDTEAERSHFHRFRNTERRQRPVEASRPR